MTENSPNHRASTSTAGKYTIAALVILLIILHQDNWFWTNDYLVFGFMPVGLFYHACISVAATCVWFLATKIAWPVDVIERTKAASREVNR